MDATDVNKCLKQIKLSIFLHKCASYFRMPSDTVSPRGIWPFYIVTYHMKWSTTSWTDGISTKIQPYCYEPYGRHPSSVSLLRPRVLKPKKGMSISYERASLFFSSIDIE